MGSQSPTRLSDFTFFLLSCLLFLMSHASHWLFLHHFLAKLGIEPHSLSLLDLEAAA